jgi:hypothetical protein
MPTPSSTATSSRRGLMRWSVAAAATTALVVSGSGLVAFAQSGSGESQGPVFVPADTAMYVEARLDMPGGQADAVAQLMTAFPGFADPGSFDMKIDELISGLGAEMGMDALDGDFFGDVLTGEVGLAVGDLEGAMMGSDPSVLIGIAVADAAAASTVMGALVADGSAEFTESTYNDVVIYTDPTASPPMSVALHSDWLLIGTGDTGVQDSLDVLAGSVPSLADDADFTTAWSRLPAVRVGAAYMDFASFASLIDLASMMAEGQAGVALPTEDFAALLPIDMVASLAAENDRVTFEAIVTPGEQTPETPVGESDLALSFPADTQVYIETRELGVYVENSLAGLAEMVEAQEAMAADDPMASLGGMEDIAVLFSEDSPITKMLGVPLPEFLDFVGDAGVGAGLSSDGLWLGIAAEINDEAAAKERVTSLKTVLRLATMQAEEEGIAIETEMVGDVEVTNILIPMDQMMAETGVPIGVGDSISLAIADGKLLIGSGDFVQAAIATDGTDSLGTSDGYTDALAEDSVNSGVLYMNISSVLNAIGPMLSMMGSEWDMIAPYAAGLDRMIVVGTADDEVLRSRITAIVGQ